jgi:hypothetical protein
MDTEARRITADFNYGGRGRVYLKPETLAQIEAAGIDVTKGTRLTLSDYDADDDGNPMWLTADGMLGYQGESGRLVHGLRRRAVGAA